MAQTPAPPSTSGQHERHLALSTLVQQGTYVVGTVVMLAVVTALARTLSLSSFGVYGLMVSFATYLLVAQGAVEVAAIRAIAAASTEEDQQRAFSIAVIAYLALGLLVGVVIAVGGNLALPLFDIPQGLHHDARIGLVVLGLITAVGWPLKTFQDALRGTQRFVWSSSAEALAYVLFGAGMLTALATGSPLWVLIGLGGTIPMLTGLFCAIAVRRGGLTFRYRHRGWTRNEMRDFLRGSGYLLITSGADLFIYSLDRLILGAFRPAATVALFEGPVRAHNVIRQVQGVLVVTVLPAGTKYLADGDTERARALILRGTRYALFVTLPLVIVFMVLARPILEVWLGPGFGAGAAAMTILVGYWLFAANTNVAGSMLVAAGRMKELAIYAWSAAAMNLVLSLSLTPSLGLNGVVLGTTIPYVVLFPVFLWMVCRWLPIGLREFARDVWMPAYLTAAVVGMSLVIARLAVTPSTVWEVVALSLGAVGMYWGIVYAVWLNAGERTLVADTVRTVAARVRGRR